MNFKKIAIYVFLHIRLFGEIKTKKKTTHQSQYSKCQREKKKVFFLSFVTVSFDRTLITTRKAWKS